MRALNQCGRAALSATIAALLGAGCLTPCDAQSGSFKTVTIGGKAWMAENLNIKTDGSRCFYNSESNCEKYGRFYDWETAMKVCPKGGTCRRARNGVI